MKVILQNLKSSFYMKMVAFLFIIKFLEDFYWSVKLDSIDRLFSSLLENFTYFLILYALGMMIKEKGSKK